MRRLSLFLCFGLTVSIYGLTGVVPNYDFCGVEVIEGESLSAEKDEALLKCFDNNEANQYESWSQNLNSDLSDRVMDASNALLSAIKIDNVRFGYSGDPRNPLKRPLELQNIAKEVIRSLPKEIKRLAEDKLLAVVFIEDLGTSAYAPYTFKKNKEAYGGVMILDVSFLNKTANERQTFRERTLFDFSNEDNHFELDVTITDSEDDSFYSAVEEVIIHELGHIITYGESYVPLPGRTIDELSVAQYDFFNFHWDVVDGSAKLKPYLSTLLPFQDKFKFYRSTPPMSTEDMVAVYTGLNQTCFASLYAARSQEEDFAEGFTHYVRSFMLEKPFPYAVQVKKNGKEIVRSGLVWERSPECSYVKEYFDDLIFGQ